MLFAGPLGPLLLGVLPWLLLPSPLLVWRPSLVSVSCSPPAGSPGRVLRSRPWPRCWPRRPPSGASCAPRGARRRGGCSPSVALPLRSRRLPVSGPACCPCAAVALSCALGARSLPCPSRSSPAAGSGPSGPGPALSSWGCLVSASSCSYLVSRVAGRGPWWLGSAVPARRVARRLGARPVASVAVRRFWWRQVRRSGPCAPRFAPAVLVATCPSCGARVTSRAVGPSAFWSLCPWCGSSAFLPASAWRVSPAGARGPAAPVLQLELF